MSFEDYLKREISHNGPMDVGTFMGLAVGHYYNSRDPLGAAGDFTTAPEISQMFGEMLGAWAADCWMKMGQPSPFLLVECGPGRGTLMADALRATAKVPGFHDAAEVTLIEMSDTLKAKQRQALDGYEVQWCGGLAELPDEMPMILLANEFLDALPVRQLEYRGGKWQERVVGLDGQDALQFGLVPADAAMMALAPKGGKDGDVAEIAPVRDAFVRDVCAREQSVALFIDYGYAEGHGDTLQAMRAHKFVPVLAGVGDADLTAHVDFAALARAAQGAQVYGPAGQGEFLQRLGIAQRAAMLRQRANAAQAEDIDKGLARLTAPAEMGELFKVMAVCSQPLSLAGF